MEISTFNPFPKNAKILSGMQVTKAVHAKNGIIYAQLTHHGRYALTMYTGMPTVSASTTPFSTDEKYAYPPPGKAYHERVFLKDYPPIELSVSHVKRTITDYVAAAKMAMEAGFDGVEIHGGNGYLVEQFLSSNANVRTDDYGGSSSRRCKFALDLVAAVGDAIGIQKVAVSLSPFGVYGDMHDEQRWEAWSFLCRELRRLSKGRLSYVSFIEARKDELAAMGEFEKSWGTGREVGLGWARECLGPHIKVLSAGVWDGESVWEGVEKGVVGCYVLSPRCAEEFVIFGQMLNLVFFPLSPGTTSAFRQIGIFLDGETRTHVRSENTSHMLAWHFLVPPGRVELEMPPLQCFLVPASPLTITSRFICVFLDLYFDHPLVIV